MATNAGLAVMTLACLLALAPTGLAFASSRPRNGWLPGDLLDLINRNGNVFAINVDHNCINGTGGVHSLTFPVDVIDYTLDHV